MTTVQRPYINVKYEQAVDDGCLEYKSIPMAVVNNLVKISHATNDYTGIKQIYNLIPPRPKNINAMATSIARINNLSYSSVTGISKRFIDEEIAQAERFASSAPPMNNDFEFQQNYTPEQPAFSSTGSRLAPIEIGASRGTQTYGYGSKKSTQTDTHTMADGSTMTDARHSLLESVTVILGDIAPTSGVVPMNTGLETQTEWIMNKAEGFAQRNMVFGIGEVTAEMFVGGDVATQTELFKPPSGKNIPFGSTKTTIGFFENPKDRFGTITGTPTRQLARPDKADRAAEELVGPHHTEKRPMLMRTQSGFETSGEPSQATTGYSTPIPAPRKMDFGSY